MSKRKPAVGSVPKSQKIILSPPARLSKWAFSFRFWRQIEYFGLDKSSTAWCVSLLERLAQLSDLQVDDFLSDGAAKDAWRYHDIDWNQKNIPIKRHVLDWIHKDYLDNEEDYPLVQFQISLALGRVIGFWDENRVFCVVLLDPLHNMQPSKSHSYRLDPCSPLSCEYTSLLLQIQEAKSFECPVTGCKARDALNAIPSNLLRREVVVASLSPENSDWIHSLIASGKASSLESIIEEGAFVIEEETLVLDTEQLKGDPNA